MEDNCTMELDIESLVNGIVSDSLERHDGEKIAYDAAAEAVESHLDGQAYSMTEQMYIVETLLATRGLDKEFYLYHTLEDADRRDSIGIIEQLCENALSAITLQEGFDKTIKQPDTREVPPSHEVTVDPEAVVEDLHAEAQDRYSNGDDAFDSAYDALDAHWAELKSHSLTEQASILQHLADTHEIVDATPSEQLEESVHDGTGLLIGSLLWHNLQEYLMTTLTGANGS
jgi:hypothetical protein